MRYARFLNSCWIHFTTVSRYFPKFNPTSKSSLDALCTPNSAMELISIANHLYTCRTYGVAGAFAEFGCFKGYSTSMLSYACAQLDIEMHVFDSFEGLPPAAGTGYGAGEFKGGFDEVRANVERFGSPSVVTYHKGFFCDSLPATNMPNLISLWMDVDLESSALDVMTISNKIDPRGAVFSHECEPRFFLDGTGNQELGPAHVIPPILSGLGGKENVSGQYLHGCTGAFWRRLSGIPVLPHGDLMRIVAALPRPSPAR